MSLTKNMAYDHPAYTSRNVSFFSTIAAGGTVATATKFVAYANMLLLGLTVYTTTIGSSTYTTGLANSSPAATTSVKGEQINLLRVFNTAASGATIALATTTYGPFTVAGGFVTSGTATVQAGCFDTFQINGQGTATNSPGGVAINAGDQFYAQSGTDATWAGTVVIDGQIAPLASVTA